MLDDRNDTMSSLQMTGLGVWDHAANNLGWTALLGAAAGGPDVSPYAAPARASDLSGLPPAYIDVGSAETFRDEDVAYATRVWQAGGIAELHVWPGGFHGFAIMVPDAAISRAAIGATGQNEGTGPTGPVSASTTRHGTRTGAAGSRAFSMSASAIGSLAISTWSLLSSRH
jgi:acetyl esterase/lipase